MRSLCLLLILVALPTARAQRVDWHRVDLNIKRINPKLVPAELSPGQKADIRQLIIRTLGEDCAKNPADPFGPGVFTYSIAPLGQPGIIYVSPGMGCLRGGQGANASLWLVDTANHALHIVGAPTGWGLGIQPHTSHGLHDFVTGWHMSAFETGYAYYRFDGRRYRKIGGEDVKACAKLEAHGDDSGFCLSDGKHVFKSGSY